MSDKPTVHEALCAVMAQVQAVKKDGRNTEQNYSFRGVDSVVNAVGPALREHHVLMLPEVLEIAHRDVQTSRGKPSRECTVKVRYRFYGPAGDHLDAVSVGEAMDFGDKGTPKAMSVAFRVALLQALCIPTDEPDADSQTYERAVPQAQAARQVQPDAGPEPTEAQAVEYERLRRLILAADAEAALTEAGQQVHTSRQADGILPDQYERLRELGTKRKAAIERKAATHERQAARAEAAS